MFESAELGHKVDKAEFQTAELELRGELLNVQRAVKEGGFQTIIIVSGVEAAGKSEFVNRLHEWLDARGLSTAAFWQESDEERERPAHWRFWRALPPRGTIGILFGSWYTTPIVESAYGRLNEAELSLELGRINELERMLTDDGAVIIKLWFHLSKKAQRKRLEKVTAAQERKLTPWEKKFSRSYDEFLRVTELAVRHTDTGNAPWHIIDAEDARYRDLMGGRVILRSLLQRLKVVPTPREKLDVRLEQPGPRRRVLDRVDLNLTMDEGEYEEKLRRSQARLNELVWRARRRGRSLVAMFEGWDAAGKGGAIRRVTGALDARLFRAISIAAPTDEERAQHYLWRFWRHIPRAGSVTIYDRSWYGRVLVERVEGFASRDEYGRAYQEINDFEQQLTDHGVILVKFWLHISPEEQLRRFQEREAVDHKRYKITEDDWRNRDKWQAYEDAVDEMVARCSTTFSPWHLISANDKRNARISVLSTLIERLETALEKGSRTQR